MKRKLFAFDIDGTLLNSEKKPLKSTIESIRKLQEKGHFVTIASGRSRFLTTDVMQTFGISNYIVCNGAAAFLDHEQIFKNTLDDQVLQRMVDAMDEKKVDTAMMTLDGVYRCSSNNLDRLEGAMHSFGQDLPAFVPNFLGNHEVYQSLAFYTSEMDAEVEAEFPEFRFVRWHEQGVDVVPQNGSKAETLLFVADRIGVSREDIIAFGDGNNDVEMLETAGVGVAMGNAPEAIQKHADMVTDSCDDDGIQKALEEMAFV